MSLSASTRVGEGEMAWAVESSKQLLVTVTVSLMAEVSTVTVSLMAEVSTVTVSLMAEASTTACPSRAGRRILAGHMAITVKSLLAGCH